MGAGDYATGEESQYLEIEIRRVGEKCKFDIGPDITIFNKINIVNIIKCLAL